MAISGTTTDTSGRTKDLLIFQGLDATKYNVSEPINISFGTTSAYIVGVQKLLQRFTILFLTGTGSQPDFPAFGTGFLPSVANSSAGLDAIALQHIFNFANLKLSQVFKDFQDTTTLTLPKDEQLAAATLLDFSVSSGNLSLTIGITSKAGSTVQYVLPFPIA